MQQEYKKHNNYKFIIELLLILAAVLLFVLFGKWTARFEEEKLTDAYVSVTETTLELGFSVYTREEWDSFFSEYKEAYLTREMVTGILERLGVAAVIEFDAKGTGRAVTRSEWQEVYTQILDFIDIEDKVSSVDALILKTEVTEAGTEVYTNEGTFFTELSSQYFAEWTHLKIDLIENAIVGVAQKLDTEATISNAYIIESTGTELQFLFRGENYRKEVKLGEQEITKCVADVTIADRKITGIGQKQDFIIGNLLSYDDMSIEIEGYGKLKHEGRVPVYQTYDGVEEKSISDIVLGNMEVKYIIGPNEVCAIIIMTPVQIHDVRVLLLAEEGGKFRSDVYLSGTGNFSVTCADKTTSFSAGTVISIKDYENTENETIMVASELDSDYLYFCNEKGKKISNNYSGHMEIRAYEEGYCVVNQVPFETYLYSVVPSEMPSNYAPEALKAQAICARSYAYIQVMRADLAAYGAHINDSTSYQVYNNIAKTENSIRAVDETAGKVMMYKGNVIEAYYFSTSMGYTDTAEVWNIREEEDYGYLKQACLNEESFDGDLSLESDFKLYLTQNMEGADSNIKYYRWQIEADYEDLTADMKDVLKSRRTASERHITYYKEDGKTETDSMKGFGNLKELKVAKRSNAGSILTLEVVFEHGTVHVKNEYNIRKVLGLGAEKITYQNGSTSKKIGLLPSAFCTVEKQEDGTYLLCGGGYGHGLGMSQNGANGLAKMGYSCQQILDYFYQNIEIANIGE